MKLSVVATVLFLTCAPAVAWTPKTRVHMIDEAVRLMPGSLRLALESHREPLLRGMLEPMTAEDGPGHRPPWAGGRLDRELDAAALRLLERLKTPTAFDDLAAEFGTIAHYVADAGFPPGASRQDGAKRYAHFSSFCESRREKLPFVFYGHGDRELADADYRGFALRLMRAASDNDRELARAYAAAGDPPDPAYFDDRSVPFAVGSLSYSRSITNIVRIWLSIWQRAGGDMAAIPYWKRTESREE